MPDANVWWEPSAESAWISSSRWDNDISSTFSTIGYFITTRAEFIWVWDRGYRTRLLLPRPAPSIGTDFHRATECVTKLCWVACTTSTGWRRSSRECGRIYCAPQLLFPDRSNEQRRQSRRVECHHRLGGVLKYYKRAAWVFWPYELLVHRTRHVGQKSQPSSVSHAERLSYCARRSLEYFDHTSSV